MFCNILFLFLSLITFFNINKLLFVNRSIEENFGYWHENTVKYYILSNNSNYTVDNINGNIAVLNSMNSKDFAISIFPFENVSFISYDNLSTLFNDFNNNKFSFVLIDEVTYKIIKNLYDINYNIIYDYDYSNTNSNYYIDKELYNIYIRGINENKESIYNRLLTINFKDNELYLTIIPKDLYLEFPKYNYQKDKISNSKVYDDCFIISLNQFFSIEIDYYITIDLAYLDKNFDYNRNFEYCSDEAISYDTYSIKGECFIPTKSDILNVFNGTNDEINELYLFKSYYKYLFGWDNINIMDKKYMNFNNIIDSNISKEFVINKYKNLFYENFEMKEFSINTFSGHDRILFSDYRDWIGYPDYNSLSDVVKHLK